MRTKLGLLFIMLGLLLCCGWSIKGEYDLSGDTRLAEYNNYIIPLHKAHKDFLMGEDYQSGNFKNVKDFDKMDQQYILIADKININIGRTPYLVTAKLMLDSFNIQLILTDIAKAKPPLTVIVDTHPQVESIQEIDEVEYHKQFVMGSYFVPIREPVNNREIIFFGSYQFMKEWIFYKTIGLFSGDWHYIGLAKMDLQIKTLNGKKYAINEKNPAVEIVMEIGERDWDGQKADYFWHDLRQGQFTIIGKQQPARKSFDTPVTFIPNDNNRYIVSLKQEPGGITQIKGLLDVSQIYAGIGYYMVVKKDGTVWTWGQNDLGQLGDGTNRNHFSPAQVRGVHDVIMAGTENAFNLAEFERPYNWALQKDGTLWMWGFNDYGYFGSDESQLCEYTPKLTKRLNQIKYYYNNLAVRQENTLFDWHNKKMLQKFPAIKKAFDMGNDSYIVLTEDGTLWSIGDYRYYELISRKKSSSKEWIKIMTDVVDFKPGIASVALKKDGTVWVWGSNKYGQLGLPEISEAKEPHPISKLNHITAIQAVGNLSGGCIAAVRDDGKVWAWGGVSNENLNKGLNVGIVPFISREVKQLEDPFFQNVADIAWAKNRVIIRRKDDSIWTWTQNPEWYVHIEKAK